MLTELCHELNNWFDRNQPHLHGAFVIEDGKFIDTDFLEIIQENQYFRIVGSVFNDGVYKYTSELVLSDEAFVGAVWLMAVPKEVVDLAEEIATWVTQYGDSVSSPYSSESFGGYSYTMASGGSASATSGKPSWQSSFANRLNKWRKLQ